MPDTQTRDTAAVSESEGDELPATAGETSVLALIGILALAGALSVRKIAVRSARW
jgi:LPXTG-motif cell wall-anchored protein